MYSAKSIFDNILGKAQIADGEHWKEKAAYSWRKTAEEGKHYKRNSTDGN